MKPDLYVQLLTEKSEESQKTSCYRVAGNSLLVDCAIPSLNSFRERCQSPSLPANQIDIQSKMGNPVRIYYGPGWISNRWRDVACWSLSSTYQIDLAGIGVFAVSRDGKRVGCLEREPSASFADIVEAALGPALILALALRGTWCFHGSAVTNEKQAVLFLGESGTGKSTLARWLTAQEDHTWGRHGDDILPVTVHQGRVQTLPHFPQLKYPLDDQPSRDLPEILPIRAIYILRRPDSEGILGIRPLGAKGGALALVRHTVASRLFAPDLLARHFDFCVQASNQIPVKELIYPLEPDALSMVNKALVDDLRFTPVEVNFLTRK